MPRMVGGLMAEEAPEIAATPALRCVVVEDHVLVLQMLCGVLRTVTGIDVVATGTSLRDADRLASLADVDLLILDSHLDGEDGFAVLRLLAAAQPGLKCIVLTSSACTCPPDLADRVIGIVDKADSWDSLIGALERSFGDRLKSGLKVLRREQLFDRLTRREVDVFESLGKGLSNKEIASVLGISVQTVETHRKSISKKLGCNGASLIRMATLSQQLALP